MGCDYLKDKTSVYFEKQLAIKYPELLKFVGWDEYGYGHDDQGNVIHELYFKIPPGDKNIEELFVECTNYLITIGVGPWHTHFNTQPNEIDKCIQLVDDILNEQILFCNMYKDGKMIDSLNAKLDEYLTDFSTKITPDRFSFWSFHGSYRGELTHEDYLSMGDNPMMSEIIKKLKHLNRL